MSLTKAFDQLHKGETFVTGKRTITEADILSFGAHTGDLHPQHVDANWASSSVYGERIAHGMLTLSYGLGLIPLDAAHALGLRAINSVVFVRPVKIDDTIHAKVKIRSLTRLDAHSGLVGLTVNILNQDDQVACRARVELQWKADQADSDRSPGHTEQ